MSIRLQNTPGQSARSTTQRRTTHRQTSALVPAAARTPTVLSDTELDLAGQAIETFLTAVGGRTKLLQTLAVADSDTCSDKVVNCLLDPAYASWSLRRLCAYAGLTVADLFASYKKALFVQAHIDAAQRITQELPAIVADVMRRALPLPEPCPRCYGAPTTPGTSDCPACRGVGTVLVAPDLDRQKLALELGRLIERKAGVMVQQNQINANQALSTGPGSLEQLQQAVGDLLYSPRRQRASAPMRLVDAELRDDPREPPHPVDDPAEDRTPRDEPEDPDAPSDIDDDEEDADAPLPS
jgi:hypothetical protein